MRTDGGGVLPGLLAFCVSMLVILVGVYAFFTDYRERYLEPMEALRQGSDSLSRARRDSLLADSLRRELSGRVTQTLARQADSLRVRRQEQARSGTSPPGITPPPEERTVRPLRLSAEDEVMLLRVLRAMQAPRAAKQLRRLGPEAAAGVLFRMAGRQQTEILAALPPEEREAYRRALEQRRTGPGRS